MFCYVEVLTTVARNALKMFTRKYFYTVIHYNDVTWTLWCIKSPTIQLFIQQHDHEQRKRHISPLREELIGKRRTGSPHKVTFMREVF